MSLSEPAPADDVTGEIEQRRAALERLAESDYAIANAASALLEIAEEGRE